MQQALLGLNQRRQAAFDYLEKRDSKAAKSPFTRWSPGQAPDYTQQQAQQVLEQNTGEDNAALVKLAERLGVSSRGAGAGVRRVGAVRCIDAQTSGEKLKWRIPQRSCYGLPDENEKGQFVC